MSIPGRYICGWVFSTEAADSVELFFWRNKPDRTKRYRDRFVLEKTIHDGGSYAIGLANTHVQQRHTSLLDAGHPRCLSKISVEAATDSSDHKYVFLGNARMIMVSVARHFTIPWKTGRTDTTGNLIQAQTKCHSPVPATRRAFTYALTWIVLPFSPAIALPSLLETWDNDGVHGPKATRTGVMQFAVPTLDELKDTRDANNDAVEEGLEKVGRVTGYQKRHP